ncbi:MAG TPA: PTS glucose transporter subunit IIB, partial [Clostridiales bacterium]|nr:PTS glucose transporter subunit IIB [Clostridiales bacterium]
GVGSPLLYGVTLPLGSPFVTACLGGGFGGAFIMVWGVASSGWGASGLLGIPMMGAGPVGTKGMLLYCVGLAISCVMGFVLTYFTISEEKVQNA